MDLKISYFEVKKVENRKCLGRKLHYLENLKSFKIALLIFPLYLKSDKV